MKVSRHRKLPRTVVEGQPPPTEGTPEGEVCDLCKKPSFGLLATVKDGATRRRACASCCRAVLRRRAMARRRQ